MRQPQTGCNAAPAIVTASAQFVPIEEVRSKTCGLKPIDFSYSLGYHVSHLPSHTPHLGIYIELANLESLAASIAWVSSISESMYHGR